MPLKSAEILFVKSVKDGIPNRDPLNDSNARRLFGEDDLRISLSDVSIKRDVRDYVYSLFPDGGSEKRYFIWCREERDENGRFLLGRDKLAAEILKKAEVELKSENEAAEQKLFQAAFDMRVFGAVFSVKGRAFHRTGPVQFGWAHSLHPVQTKYVQGTTTMPSKDVETKEGEETTGKSQGTIWTMYYLPFAVFAMSGVVNAALAERSGMDERDLDLLLEALWKGTIHRQGRGRGIQQPLLLICVEYDDPYFRIGYLEEQLTLFPDREVWLGDNPPTSVGEIKLNITKIAQELQKNQAKIHRIRWWKYPGINMEGSLPEEPSSF